jgi:pyridoxamine 5'-phosphate oxidase
MCLSTNGADGYPSNRIVYLREITEAGLIFYTNYNSLKGEEIAANEKTSLNFFWAELHRQVRVKGDVERVDQARSDAYFASRPRESQLGAWASMQSSPLDSRESLQLRIAELEKEFKGKEIERPEHWGGYILKPVDWEFWKGRSSRLHDRFRYVRESENWKITRLYP